MVAEVVTELLFGQIIIGIGGNFGFQSEGDRKLWRVLHKGVI